MRVPDRCVADLRDRGYLIFEGFLEADELAAAQDALWLHYPRPDEYFADPPAHAWLANSQWAGEIRGPWRSWSLNRLAFHPDLLDLAERFLGSADLRLYEAELWAKYAGAVDYDQCHHRDFVNHSLVVPKRSQPGTQMLNWILLSDVGDEDGPTKVVPLPVGERLPCWTGRVAWAERAMQPDWFEIVERATPRERSVFGWPAPGDPYWDDQTLADTQTRYPGADLTPYR